MPNQINIEFLFFGLLRDLLGASRVGMTIENGSNLADAILKLRKLYPHLERGNLLHAVNEKYVTDHTRLCDGDEVAIFTPVSGG